MYDDEPRMFMNKPLTALSAVLSSAILFSQVICLMFITFYWWFYFFECAICFLFIFIFSIGIKKKRKGHITSYSIFLAMYMFWVTFGMIFYILAYSWVGHLPICPPTTETPTVYNKHSTPAPCKNHDMNGTDITALVFCIISSCVSVLLCIYQTRLCFLLYRLMKNHDDRNRFNVSYQTQFPPGAMPPPPGYMTPYAPPNSTAQNNGPPPNLQQQAGPLPEKPPGYVESVPSTPVALQPETLTNVSTFNPPITTNQYQNQAVSEPTTILTTFRPPTAETPVFEDLTFEEIDILRAPSSHPQPIISHPEDLSDFDLATDLEMDDMEELVLSPTNPFTVDVIHELESQDLSHCPTNQETSIMGAHSTVNGSTTGNLLD